MDADRSVTTPPPVTAVGEFSWQPCLVAAAGMACAAAVLPTVSFPRYVDYLLFLVYGAVLADVALLTAWAGCVVLLLPVAALRRRASRAAAWASQATRWILVVLPTLGAVPIAFNRSILWGERVDLRRPSVWQALVGGAALSLLVLVLRRVLRGVLVNPRRQAHLAAVLACATLVAAGVGWGVGGGPAPTRSRVAEDPRSVPRPARPVLVIGIDSLGHGTLAGLAAAGDLPTFQGLISRGGLAKVVGPSTNSCELFASIATAAAPPVHGVQTHFHVKFPAITSFPLHYSHRNLWLAYALGVPLLATKVVEAYPPPRDRWRVEPMWTRARAAGLSTAVVGWLGSWPVETQDGDVFPYMGARSSWEVFYRYRRGRFAPGGWFGEERVCGLVREPSDGDAEDLAALGIDAGVGVGRAEALSGELSLLDQSHGGYARYEHLGDASHAAIAELAIRERRPDVAWVYFGGLDVVEHVFWPCWRPDRYPDGPGRPVPERERQPVLLYFKWLDGVLARLLAAYEVEPIVVIVGDHDMVPSPGHPLFPAWHGGAGALVVRDPDRRPSMGEWTLKPEDVGDMVASFCGLGTSAGWQASPLREALGR